MGSPTAASASCSPSLSSSSFTAFEEVPMPFSSYYSSAQLSAPHFRAAEQNNGEDSAACPAAVGSSGTDGYDCESEEGIEVREDAVKRAPAPRSSGLKRSRAAEVHNLSEKRRRSKINEKMKALQNLIPNSNKTDKASMLDEAIEYLKQLQLQVQMLSMRNGLNVQSMYLPGMQHFLASQVSTSIGVTNELMMNTNIGMLTLNPEASTQNTLDPLNRCSSSHPPVVLPGLSNVSNPESSFRIESSTNCGSFKLPEPAEGFVEGMAQRHEAGTSHVIRAIQENQETSTPTIASVAFNRQEVILGAERLETCAVGRESSQDMLPKDQAHLIFVQHFHSLQEGRSFSGDVKAESPTIN